MHDGYQDRNHQRNQSQMFHPPAWLSTEELEDELLHSIHANAGEADSRLTIIDECFAGDDAFEVGQLFQQQAQLGPEIGVFHQGGIEPLPVMGHGHYRNDQPAGG